MTGKLAQIEIFLDDESPDFFMVSEHGLTTEKLNMMSIQNYTLMTAYSREDMRFGGVAIFKKENLNLQNVKTLRVNEKITETKIFEACEMKIEIGKQKLVLCTVYRSPDENANMFIDKLNEYIAELKRGNRNANLIIGGDFNINTLIFDRKTELLQNITSSYGMKTTIDVPTRVTETTATCIDNFITDVDKENSAVVEPNISDHHAIAITIPVVDKPKIAKKKIKARSIKESNLQELKIRLKGEKWKEVFDEPDMNKKYENFLNGFLYYYNISCPVKEKEVKEHTNIKWISEEIVNLKNDMVEKYNIWKNNRSEQNRHKYREALKKYRKTVNDTKSTHLNEKIVNADNKQKKAWEIVNQFRGKTYSAHKNLKLDINGELENDPLKNCEHLNEYFANIAEEIKKDLDEQKGRQNQNNVQTHVRNMELRNFREIERKELRNIFTSFKPKTSTGHDEICMKALKYCMDELVEPIRHIINTSILHGTFPNGCKVAKIRPLFKKGDENGVCNYRPISLLPVFSKFIEKAICNQFVSYLEENNLLSGRQFGFQKKKSTKLALIDFANNCIDAVEAGETVMACFADLSKAFDCVDPEKLLTKLSLLGVKEKALNWFKSYMTDRHHFTEILQESNSKFKFIRSDRRLVTCGVPQGSVLGPILFLIYINDITDVIPENNLFIFADDTTLVTRHKNCDELELDTYLKMNTLSQYFAANSLKLNPDKTRLICIQTHQRKLSNTQIGGLLIGGTEVNVEESANLLGVTLDGCFNWSGQLGDIESRLAKAIFVIRRLSVLKNQALLKNVYHCLLESHISYSIVLWGSTKGNLEKILKWQKKAIRGMLGLPPQTHCRELFRQLGILTAPSLYIFEISVYIKNRNPLQTHTHNHNTRHKHISAEHHRLTFYEQKPLYAGQKIFQILPEHIRTIDTMHKFKIELKTFLFEKAYYSLHEFLSPSHPEFIFYPA